MDIDIQILWTDALVYVLVVTIIAFFFYTRSHPHLATPWRQVFHRRLGMSALLILLGFVSIGLLDSIHYRVGDNPETLSVFDKLAGPLRSQVEKSFSAPFATQLYARETIELPDGKKIRGYPRLQYGGSHLNNPQQDRLADIIDRSLSGLVTGTIAWSLLVLVVLILLARRHGIGVKALAGRVWRGDMKVPWKVIFATVGVIVLLFSMVVSLAGYYHILGTDKVGNDVLFLALKSIRTGLVIGTLTTLVMLPFAVLLGITAGYFRGWVDDLIQYIYTTLSSIPSILLIAAFILMLQVYMSNHPDQFPTVIERADARLLFLCLILGITSWTGLCRLLRGEALKISQVDYIQAATAFGVRHLRIITRHILPNVMHIVMISIVLDFSALVLAEAVLAYVGVGVDPTMNSWGNMINSARLEMAREPIVWWSLMAAFMFMFTLVLAANLFSDAVRDAFDPRLRKG
ncbi:MAG: ABC transporter permease [Gammaproteobacteria bacterium]|nr:MAG: ABC transporter permease [Gammaproteobacteria bacterium]